MGRKGEQACRLAVWTCSELAAFLSPSFLCFLSLLLSDGLLLAQFLSGFSPPAFRYKSLPGCYTSAVFFFSSFRWKIPFNCTRILTFSSCVWTICGSISESSDLPFSVLGFLFKSECADTVTAWPQPVYTAGKGRRRSPPPTPTLTLIPVTIFFYLK